MLSFKSGLSLAAVLIMLAPAPVLAHCDRLDGPVATDARTALAEGNFDAVAVWVGDSQTEELRSAFEQARLVREESPNALKLAERWFIETAVRLHRQAEGMPYDGMKPAGLPTPPDIAAADRAYASGNVEPVVNLLAEALDSHVRELFHHAVESKGSRNQSLESGREAIDNYVRFVEYVHGLYDQILAGPKHGVGDEASLHPTHNPEGTEMNTTYLQRTIGDIVTEQPGRSRVFEDLGIDYCCGGNRPLAQACREKGLDPGTVIERLVRADETRGTDSAVDYSAMSLTDLVDHILQTHHAYLNQALPRVGQLVAKVAEAHAESPKGEDLRRLNDRVQMLTAELRSHMMKEENILFPAIKRIDAGEAGTVIDGPVTVMMREHDSAGEALAAVHSLTDDLTVPEWGCNTYRAMIDALGELEQDLHQHIHKENNVLFPRAQDAASNGA